MFGQWDPTVGAAIERAVDLVADELWRAKHPNRNPTRHEETTLKFRRAEAVSEIARRVLARTEQTDDRQAADGAEVESQLSACDAPTAWVGGGAAGEREGQAVAVAVGGAVGVDSDRLPDPQR